MLWFRCNRLLLACYALLIEYAIVGYAKIRMGLELRFNLGNMNLHKYWFLCLVLCVLGKFRRNFTDDFIS